jgi:hypothetical protein
VHRRDLNGFKLNGAIRTDQDRMLKSISLTGRQSLHLDQHLSNVYGFVREKVVPPVNEIADLTQPTTDSADMRNRAEQLEHSPALNGQRTEDSTVRVRVMACKDSTVSS